MQIQHDSATNHIHVTTTETSGKLGKIDVSIKGDKSKNESKYFLSETILSSDEMTSQHLVCAQTVLKVSLLVLHHFYAVFLFN